MTTQVSPHGGEAGHSGASSGDWTLAQLQFSDLYLEPDGRVWFKRFLRDPFRHSLDGVRRERVNALRVRALESSKADFRLECDGVSLRGRVMPTLSGDVVVFRRLLAGASVPAFGDLYKPKLVNAMMAKSLADGGLVLFTGPTASAKTVGLVSYMIARLRAFGGMGTTIENPVEIVFGGEHAGEGGVTGTVYQQEVDDDREFREEIRARSRVAPNFMMLGELRTGEAVAEACLASTGGCVVGATYHAQDQLTGLQRMLAMVREARYDPGLLVNSLAVVVQQTMKLSDQPDGTVVRTLDVSPLVLTETDGGAIRDQLMKADLRSLNGIIDRQERAMNNPSPEVAL